MNTGVVATFLNVFTQYIDSGFGLLGGEVAFLSSTLVVIDATRCGGERRNGAAERADAVEAEIAATLRAAFARITADAPRARMGDIAPLVRRPVPIDPAATYSEIGVRSFYRGLFTRIGVAEGPTRQGM